jgi:hypothetical protein
VAHERWSIGAARGRNSVPLLPEAGKEAKRQAAVNLEVWAGVRTPLQAAEALGLSLPRYYQIEARGLQGLVAAGPCPPCGWYRWVAPSGQRVRHSATT